MGGALFEAVPDPCLVLDCEFVIVAANEAYLKATLTFREEIVGLGIHEVFRDLVGEDGTALADLTASLRRVVQTRQPDTMPVTRFDIEVPHLLRSVLENLLGNAYKYSAQKKQAVVEFGSEQ
ncbi:PAS domain-containing protein [Geomonas sp. Red32]|uniref:PAS domain-containing protein n=1 Tax=Geomonas sp. Red32 TaxID=2912856 RepID=UPI00202CDB72|nr:PAS domain-containing protein [Geomonas sp. Red32]MCM0081480.1 PAS domain-containing protein [Geomonas sp. Red32]